MSDAIAPLREFVVTMTALVSRTADERTLLTEGRAALSRLIADDSWLPEAFARPRPDRYAQYLLHCDALERFSVVSFVWGPGQRTPVHDHTVWGLVGVLRGAERCEEYTAPGAPGAPGALGAAPSGVNSAAATPCPTGRAHRMQPGDIEAVSPTVGDWHLVGSAREDSGTTVSIHVYGANIGAVRRHRVVDAGRIVDFVSGYDAAELPNLWDRSATVRAGLATAAASQAR
jgi:predicted metal-dependent enzyme (double-stranded beta helix superfamily)